MISQFPVTSTGDSNTRDKVQRHFQNGEVISAFTSTSDTLNLVFKWPALIVIKPETNWQRLFTDPGKIEKNMFDEAVRYHCFIKLTNAYIPTFV